jgi:hypothetical protein
MSPTPCVVKLLCLRRRSIHTTVSIDTTLCQDQVPCVVDAYYTGEPDNATPADRYTFLKGHSHNVLYLYPGHYRLRAWNAAGATLGQENIDVAMH